MPTSTRHQLRRQNKGTIGLTVALTSTVMLCSPQAGLAQAKKPTRAPSPVIARPATSSSPAVQAQPAQAAKAMVAGLAQVVQSVELEIHPSGVIRWLLGLRGGTDSPQKVTVFIYEQKSCRPWVEGRRLEITRDPHQSVTHAVDWTRDRHALRTKIEVKDGNRVLATLWRVLPQTRIDIPRLELSGTPTRWSFSIANNGAIEVRNIYVRLSQRERDAWVPVADAIRVGDLAVGVDQRSGEWPAHCAAGCKVDVLIRDSDSEPFELLASRTEKFTPHVVGAPANHNVLGITAPTISRFGETLRWEVTVTNSVGATLRGAIADTQVRRQSGEWTVVGSTIIQDLSASQSRQVSLTFLPKDWQELRIVARRDREDEDLIGTSPAVGIDLTYAVTDVDVSNVQIASAGAGRYEWSAQIVNNSRLDISGVEVKTYHRSGDGQWVQASPDKTLGRFAPGVSRSTSGVFTPGNSNQFRIMVTCIDPSYHMGVRTLSVAVWNGAF